MQDSPAGSFLMQGFPVQSAGSLWGSGLSNWVVSYACEAQLAPAGAFFIHEVIGYAVT